MYICREEGDIYCFCHFIWSMKTILQQIWSVFTLFNILEQLCLQKSVGTCLSDLPILQLNIFLSVLMFWATFGGNQGLYLVLSSGLTPGGLEEP